MAGIGLSPQCVTYIENLWVYVINLLSYSFISTSIYNSVHHTCGYNQLQNRSNHFDTPGMSRNLQECNEAWGLNVTGKKMFIDGKSRRQYYPERERQYKTL